MTEKPLWCDTMGAKKASQKPNLHKERFPATDPSGVITLSGPSAFLILKKLGLGSDEL